jgi:hypothetical protein
MEIEFTDNTIIESYGNYRSTCELMREDGSGSDWMLASRALIQTDLIVATYSLHFQSDGSVRIMDTDRPIDIAARTMIFGTLDLVLKEWRETNRGSQSLVEDPAAISLEAAIPVGQRLG